MPCGCLGQVVVKSLSTPEKYSFDMKRPMRTVAMEPNFARRGSRAFVSGGLSGALVLREKGWLGHKETTIYQGDGSIWQVRWRGNLMAWATDNVSIVITHCLPCQELLFRASEFTITPRSVIWPLSTDQQIAHVQIYSNAISTGKTTLLSLSVGPISSK